MNVDFRPPAPPPDNLPPPASYQSGPPPPASNSYAIAGAGTQPHYDLPQQPRPQPSVRIDTTAYDPQPLQEEPGQEGQEEGKHFKKYVEFLGKSFFTSLCFKTLSNPKLKSNQTLTLT